MLYKEYNLTRFNEVWRISFFDLLSLLLLLLLLSCSIK